GGQIGDLELFDPACATLALEQARPRLLDAAGERRNHAQSGDDDTSHALASLKGGPRPTPKARSANRVYIGAQRHPVYIGLHRRAAPTLFSGRTAAGKAPAPPRPRPGLAKFAKCRGGVAPAVTRGPRPTARGRAPFRPARRDVSSWRSFRGT